MDNNNTLSPTQVAQFLGMEYQNLLARLEKGFLGAIKVTKNWSIPVKELNDFVAKFTGNPQSFGAMYATGEHLDVQNNAPIGHITPDKAAKILGIDLKYLFTLIAKRKMTYNPEFSKFGFRYIPNESLEAFQANWHRKGKRANPAQGELGMEGDDSKSIPALLALEEKVAKLSIELANVKSIANLALKIVEENIVKFQMDRIAELNRKEQENGKAEATWQQ